MAYLKNPCSCGAGILDGQQGIVAENVGGYLLGAVPPVRNPHRKRMPNSAAALGAPNRSPQNGVDGGKSKCAENGVFVRSSWYHSRNCERASIWSSLAPPGNARNSVRNSSSQGALLGSHRGSAVS